MLKSYLSNKIEKRESKIHGQGLFAKEDIQKNEIVFIKSGRILTREQLFSSGVINSYFPIDDNYFLGVDEGSKEAEDNVKLFINHSCNPNCGIRGEITFVAIRDIAAGEELATDYAFVDNEDYSFQCNCGEKQCRHTVTGRDWKIKSLQENYFNYFATYLKEKITNI